MPWPEPDRHLPVVTRRRVPGDGPRLLLLHGMANNSRVWDATCDRLRPGPDVWTADLPWRADGPVWWGHRPDPTSWVAQALDEVHATAGPVDVLVAHSFAAVLALELLAGHPDAARESIARRWGVHRLVLVSPFYRSAPEDFDWGTVAGLAEHFVNAMQEGIRVTAAGRVDPGKHRAMAERVCEGIGPYGWSRFLELYLRTPWLPVAAFTLPTLVVTGERDAVAPHRESRELVRRAPSAVLREVAGAGHFPMVERVTDFTDLLDAFLTTEPDAPANDDDVRLERT